MCDFDLFVLMFDFAKMRKLIYFIFLFQFEQAKRPSFLMDGQYAPAAPGGANQVISNPRLEAAAGRIQAMNNQDAANALKAMLKPGEVSNTSGDLC